MAEETCGVRNPANLSVVCDIPGRHDGVLDESGNRWDHRNSTRNRYWTESGVQLIDGGRVSAAGVDRSRKTEQGVRIQTLTALYHDHVRREPVRDAGGHPSLELHEVVGAAWATWERQRMNLRAALADALVSQHLDERTWQGSGTGEA